MNKNTIYIVVAVLIVVIVVGVAGFYLLGNQGGQTTTPTPTPTPSVPVSDASSLQFSVNITTTETGYVECYQYACKNLNTATEAVRIDMDLGDAGIYNYIVDRGTEQSWMSMDEGATWMAGDFEDDWAIYGTLFHDYVDKLVNDGGDDGSDYSYTSGGTTIDIFCIAINPTLSDSLFATS